MSLNFFGCPLSPYGIALTHYLRSSNIHRNKYVTGLHFLNSIFPTCPGIDCTKVYVDGVTVLCTEAFCQIEIIIAVIVQCDILGLNITYFKIFFYWN